MNANDRIFGFYFPLPLKSMKSFQKKCKIIDNFSKKENRQRKTNRQDVGNVTLTRCWIHFIMWDAFKYLNVFLLRSEIIGHHQRCNIFHSEMLHRSSSEMQMTYLQISVDIMMISEQMDTAQMLSDDERNKKITSCRFGFRSRKRFQVYHQHQKCHNIFWQLQRHIIVSKNINNNKKQIK